MEQELFSYIAACPTAFQAVAHTAQLLEGEGYRALRETEEWTLEPGGRYYVQRNGSSLIAFRLPQGRPAGFMMTAAHGDSPSFKIKENASFPARAIPVSAWRATAACCAPAGWIGPSASRDGPWCGQSGASPCVWWI